MLAVSIYAVALVGVVGAGDVAFSDGHWAALLVVVGIGCAALAVLIDYPAPASAGDIQVGNQDPSPTESRAEPQEPAPSQPRAAPLAPPVRRSVLASIIAFVALFYAAQAIWLAVDPAPDLLGDTDRMLLMPVVVLPVVLFGRVLRLRRWVTHVAAVAAVLIPFSDGQTTDWPAELVAAAGPTDLATSQKQQRIIGMLSTRRDRGAGVVPSPRRDGMRCQRIIARDQRRTLVGAAGSRIEVTAEACWLDDNAPFAVQVVASGVARDSPAELHATQIVGTDPLRRSPTRALIQPAHVPASPSSPLHGISGPTTPLGRLKPFRPDGRVTLPGEDGPVTVRVSPDGREIDLVLGWLAIDPLAGDDQESGGATNAGGADVWPGVVALGERPRRNEVLEVFSAHFTRLRRSVRQA